MSDEKQEYEKARDEANELDERALSRILETIRRGARRLVGKEVVDA